MIVGFRHRGLEVFFLTGSKAGIQSAHALKLGAMLRRLNEASKPQDMALPGWGLHALKGDLRGHWSVWVNANWRLTFRFVGADAELVDYLDYH
jgi:proteic killer suppression protein